MDPVTFPGLAALTANPAAMDTGNALPGQMAFQSVYREALAKPPVAEVPDIRGDMRTLGNNLTRFERSVDREQFNLMRVLAHSATQSSPGAAANGTGAAGGDRGHFKSFGEDMLSRNADRVSGRPIFSDARPDGSPEFIQSALGLPDATDVRDIDFAKEISGLTSRLDDVMGRLKTKINENPGSTIQDNVKHTTEVQTLVRRSDDLQSQRSMLVTLHISAIHELRTRMLIAFEHASGSFKKLNEIFNQLKQGS